MEVQESVREMKMKINASERIEDLFSFFKSLIVIKHQVRKKPT